MSGIGTEQYGSRSGRFLDQYVSFSSDAVPNIEYPCRHLINIPSPYTKEELKAVLMAVGWLVGYLSIHPWPCDRGDGKMVLVASVRHSQSVSVTPPKHCVAAEKSGTVIFSHCTCLAGLGEACSHIIVEAHKRLKDTSFVRLNMYFTYDEKCCL